jgi:hypothetical protein
MKYRIIEYDINREDTDFSMLEKYYDRTCWLCMPLEPILPPSNSA